MKKKEILEKVIPNLKTEKDNYCRIMHKKGWLGFLADGDLVFQPSELHMVLDQIIKENPPAGEKLFHRERRYEFTITGENKPYRPEEALERFVVVSNPLNFWNQIPIGGGKESIDIGIEDSDEKFIFVELKPWSSTNTPLYAIVESLKNLIEYRYILKKGIIDIPRYKEIDLIVLAPWSYYDDFGLHRSASLQNLKRALNDLSVEFNTNISLMELQIQKKDFDGICEEKKIDELGRIRVSETDAISELAWDQWKLLVSSDRKH